MELISTPWQVVTIALILPLGIFVASGVGRRFQTTRGRAIFLYFWHTIFCILFAFYTLEYGGDAAQYYYEGSLGTASFSLGTDSIDYISTFLVSGLGLSLLGTFLVFGIIGLVGLLAFDASLRIATADKSRNMQRLATLIILLPSVSFWSSGIGKDAISFTAIGLALWAALNLKKRTWLLATAILLMLLVRPHIAAIMIMALAGSLVMQKKISLSRRLIMGGATLAASAVMIPLALNYAGLHGGVTGSDLSSYVEQRQQYNQEGGGGVDISSMSFPMQLFTYLFRPLPFEAYSISSLAASLDNVILLLLFAAGGLQIVKRRKLALTGNRTFLWLYCLMACSILALNTANLGISVRQKWMFAPILIYLLISVMGKRRNDSQRQRRIYARTTSPPILRGKTFVSSKSERYP